MSLSFVMDRSCNVAAIAVWEGNGRLWCGVMGKEGKVLLDLNGVVEVMGSAHEQGWLDKLVPDLQKQIQKGIDFSRAVLCMFQTNGVEKNEFVLFFVKIK